METRIVIICGECGAFWDPACEPAACRDSSREHHRFDSHLHRSRVVLPDSTELTAVSFGSVDPYARDVPPDLGLYLVPDDPVPVIEVLGSGPGSRDQTGEIFVCVDCQADAKIIEIQDAIWDPDGRYESGRAIH